MQSFNSLYRAPCVCELFFDFLSKCSIIFDESNETCEKTKLTYVHNKFIA